MTHLDYCMTELGGSCSCGALNVPPEWTNEAIRIATTPGIRVKRWRLTEAQANDLRNYTGQSEMLLGHLVEVKETA